MTTVRDIMQRDVITVSPSTSVREISQTLARESIGGVPVVDDDGKVVGMVSATDIVRATAQNAEVELGFEAGAPTENVEEREGALDEVPNLLAPDRQPGWVRPIVLSDPVDDLDATSIMTPATFSVRPDISVAEFAEFLLRGRIHRALVLEAGVLVGIATSFDALRALVGPEHDAEPVR
jgi:CBS domain-containing protein